MLSLLLEENIEKKKFAREGEKVKRSDKQSIPIVPDLFVGVLTQTKIISDSKMALSTSVLKNKLIPKKSLEISFLAKSFYFPNSAPFLIKLKDEKSIVTDLFFV